MNCGSASIFCDPPEPLQPPRMSLPMTSGFPERLSSPPSEYAESFQKIDPVISVALPTTAPPKKPEFIVNVDRRTSTDPEDALIAPPSPPWLATNAQLTTESRPELS